jgi:xanthine dehydrogenase molybdenum-binding subunit
VDKWYDTQTVQHCHIENFIAYAYEESGKIVVVSSTQSPNSVRRTVGQALGVPWGKIRIIKPYIGGGFGNKQDTLYEPLAAYVSQQLGGRLVKIDIPREDTFVSNRVRHAIRSHIVSWVRPDGTYVARKLEAFSDQGAYASHGHSIVAKGTGAFPQMYPCPNVQCDAYTVYTNKSTAGAMRAYGIPQAMFAVESHTDDVCRALGMDPEVFRRKNLMPVGFKDHFSKNENYFDSYNQCLDKAIAYMDYHKKMEEYRNQTGLSAGEWEFRASGIIPGCGRFPRAFLLPYGTERGLAHCSCRWGDRIGQGADTAFAQMAADAVGIRDYRDVYVVTNQDTDTTPFGLGAYASRQTYVAGFSIAEAGQMLKEKILKHAAELTRVAVPDLDIVDSNIVRVTDGRVLMSLAELATEVTYSLTNSRHITAESSYQIKNNAYSFGCCIAEVEVDIPLCKATVVKIVNVHDCGRLINPALAEAQVHGGMSMGIGYGLSEQLLFDPKTGKALNNNLLDYKLSTIMDHPHLEAQFVENSEPTSPFGTKALGEPPTTPVAPAIRNAILNATGVAIDRLPMNPHTLFQRFMEEGLIADPLQEDK